MKKFQFFYLLASCLFGALVLTACSKDDDPLNGAKSAADIEWEQHEYQVFTSGISMSEIKWNGFYASIFEVWPSQYKSQKEGARFFLSHYRWFPAQYGPTFWTEKLDNGDWYYEGRYGSHQFELNTLKNGEVEMTVEWQGQTWKGVLTDGDVELTTEAGSIVTLKRVPPKAYDGSYDDILETIL